VKDARNMRPKMKRKVRKVKAWAVIGPKGGLVKIRQLKCIAQDDVAINNRACLSGWYQRVVPCTITYEERKDGK